MSLLSSAVNWLLGFLADPLEGFRHLLQAGGMKRVTRWLVSAMGEIVGLAVTGLIAWGICMLALWLGKAFWLTFSNTHLGESYRALYPVKAMQIELFYNMNLLDVARQITCSAVVFALAVSVAVQITFIRLFFYEPAGIVVKLTFWFLPFVAGTSALCEVLHGYRWSTVVWICAIPSSMVFHHTLNLLPRIVPDGLVPNMLLRALYEVKYLCLKVLGKADPGQTAPREMDRILKKRD